MPRPTEASTEEKGTVRFAEGTKTGALTPQYDASTEAPYPKHPSYRKMKKQVLQCFRDDKFDALNEEFKKYDESVIREFYEEQGFCILLFAVLCHKDTKALDFVTRTAPLDVLTTHLKHEDCNILNSFLLSQRADEKDAPREPNWEKITAHKFDLLLGINKEIITRFMSSCSTKDRSTNLINSRFETALTRSNQIVAAL